MEGEKRHGRAQQGEQPEEHGDKFCDEGGLTGEVWKPGPWTPLHKIEPQRLTSELAVTRNPAEDATARKCQPKDYPSSAPSKGIRLRDHIPQSLVFDSKTRDMRSLKLSGFQHQVTVEEVKQLCKDAVQICHRFGHGCKLLCSVAQYESEQRALEAATALKKARLRGCPFHVFPYGARWNRLKHPLEVLDDTLNLHGVPEEFYAKGKLGPFFPTGDVVHMLLDGSVQVKFPSATELIKAVKDPKCWTIGGANIQFALAVAKKGTVRAKRNQEEHYGNKENSLLKPECSLGARLKDILISQTVSRKPLLNAPK